MSSCLNLTGICQSTRTGKKRLEPAKHTGTMLCDGVLITGSCLQGRLLGIEGEMMPALAEEAITLSGGCDAAVAANQQRIVTELRREEQKFGSTLEAGTGSACTTRCLSPGKAHPEASLPLTAATKAALTAALKRRGVSLLLCHIWMISK